MNINQLKVFVSVYNEASFGSAAKELGMSVQNASKTIGNLERELGRKLFIRSIEGVQPTRFGHGFYGIAEQAICAFFLCEALSENRRPRSGNSKTPRLLAVIPGVEDVQSVRSDIEDLTLKQTEFGLDLTFGTLSVGLEMLCHRAVDALVTTRPVENSIVGHACLGTRVLEDKSTQLYLVRMKKKKAPLSC